MTIKLKTKRDPTTGVVSLDKILVDPKTININTTENEATSPAFMVTAVVSFPNYSGLGGQYTIAPASKPIANSGKVVKVDLTQFAQSLITDAISTQPPAFNPKSDIASLTPIKVKFQVTTVLNSDSAPRLPPRCPVRVRGMWTVGSRSLCSRL